MKNLYQKPSAGEVSSWVLYSQHLIVGRDFRKSPYKLIPDVKKQFYLYVKKQTENSMFSTTYTIEKYLKSEHLAEVCPHDLYFMLVSHIT